MSNDTQTSIASAITSVTSITLGDIISLPFKAGYAAYRGIKAAQDAKNQQAD